MDHNINLYDFYINIINEIQNTEFEFNNITSDKGLVKQFLKASLKAKLLNKISSELIDIFVEHGTTDINIYLNYIKEYIEKKYIEQKPKEYIESKLIKNSISLQFNNIYKILLDELLKNDFITNMIEYSNIAPVIIKPDDCVKNTIENYTPRPNQKEAFDRLEKFGLETGIHCQATGCGKSFIILKYIDYCIRKYEKCNIILFTERVSILCDLFSLTNKIEKKNKIKIWKEQGIADLSKIKFIDRITKKKHDWFLKLKQNQKNLLIINRMFLTKNSIYKKIKQNDIQLIIHDECHNVSSNECFNFLNYCKNINVPLVGFSATPIRSGRKQFLKTYNIYGSNKNINILTDYSFLNAIKLNLIVEPEFIWFYTNFDNKKIVNNDDVIKLLNILNSKITSFPFRKIIAWCGLIDTTKEWAEKIKTHIVNFDNLKNLKICIDINYTGNYNYGNYDDFKEHDNNSLMLCARKHKEGSDIKNLDTCIFLDRIKSRDSLTFIQSIGRVLRKNHNKNYGYIFDSIENNNYDIMVNKILEYYENLQNISNINDISIKEQNKRYDYIYNNIHFGNNKITLKINDKQIIINTTKIIFDNNIFNKLKKTIKNRRKIENCRDPSMCFYNNEKIKHITSGNKDEWIFHYDKNKKKFIFNNNEYDNMNQITNLHYKITRPDRGQNNNAWWECFVFRNNEWCRTHNLQIIK